GLLSWRVECFFQHSPIPTGLQEHEPSIFRTIITLKTLAVPTIFAVRTSDIRTGLGRMTHRLLPRLCVSKSRPLVSV
ncbi:unnamed protein product, partial [Allacma fusca]